MGLLDDCQSLFDTSDLYEVIGVAKTASEADVKRGYHKCSLKVHPDRAPEDPQATVKFQTLARVYTVLSDPDQRGVYDEQGIVDEESDSLDTEKSCRDFFGKVFSRITVQDILDFEKSYRDTDEERADLMRIYTQRNGDMASILQYALCSDDEDRVRAILQEAIDAGDLPPLRAFTHESSKKKASRKRRAEKERLECEELKKKMGFSEESSLTAMIKRNSASREKQFDSFLGGLEEKYGKKPTKKKTKKERK